MGTIPCSSRISSLHTPRSAPTSSWTISSEPCVHARWIAVLLSASYKSGYIFVLKQPCFSDLKQRRLWGTHFQFCLNILLFVEGITVTPRRYVILQGSQFLQSNSWDEEKLNWYDSVWCNWQLPSFDAHLLQFAGTVTRSEEKEFSINTRFTFIKGPVLHHRRYVRPCELSAERRQLCFLSEGRFRLMRSTERSSIVSGAWEAVARA